MQKQLVEIVISSLLQEGITAFLGVQVRSPNASSSGAGGSLDQAVARDLVQGTINVTNPSPGPGLGGQGRCFVISRRWRRGANGGSSASAANWARPRSSHSLFALLSPSYHLACSLPASSIVAPSLLSAIYRLSTAFASLPLSITSSSQ